MAILRHIFLLTAFLACMPAWAVPGTPVWTDSFDPLVGDTSASHVVAAGDIVYVAGAGPFKGTPSSNADIRLRAYAVSSGALLWEDVWDAGGIRQDDEVTDIAATGNQVYIAGSSATNTSRSALVVRAYDRRNGAVLWEDHCGQFSSRAQAIASDAHHLYVAGLCSPDAEDAGLVRAYSDKGIQVWQAADLALPMDIAVQTNVVLVAGADADENLVLHAYSAKGGKLLWEVRPAAAQGLSLRSAHLVAGTGVVYLAWEAVDANSEATHQVAAYTTRNGTQRWQADPGDRVNGIALDAGRLFVVQQGQARLVSAYDARRCRLLWRDQPGTLATPYAGLAVTTTGSGEVLVAGKAFDPDSDSAPHFMVRAYASGGQLLWEDKTPTTTVQGAESLDVAWAHGIAVASGMDSRSDPPFGTTHWLVRAYSTANARKARLGSRFNPSP